MSEALPRKSRERRCLDSAELYAIGSIKSTLVLIRIVGSDMAERIFPNCSFPTINKT